MFSCYKAILFIDFIIIQTITSSLWGIPLNRLVYLFMYVLELKLNLISLAISLTSLHIYFLSYGLYISSFLINTPIIKHSTFTLLMTLFS